MTTEKHTPGPWECHKNYHDPDKYEIRSQGKGSYSAYAPLAFVKGDKRITGGNGESNARLISAAPDLLEALKEAMNVIEKIKPAEYGNGTIVRGRAAIAKATGETA